MSTTPPTNSAFVSYRLPNRMPIFTPATQQTKVMTPMNDTAGTMSTCRKANYTPTASASMLVATASGSMA